MFLPVPSPSTKSRIFMTSSSAAIFNISICSQTSEKGFFSSCYINYEKYVKNCINIQRCILYSSK